MFTEIEYRYLSSHRYGRLASIGPDGAPQIHPVAFAVDPVTAASKLAVLGCTRRTRSGISGVIPGCRSWSTNRVLNLSGRASRAVGGSRFVVRLRFLSVDSPLRPGFGTDIIRITPARIVAWNLDRPGYNSRFVP